MIQGIGTCSEDVMLQANGKNPPLACGNKLNGTVNACDIQVLLLILTSKGGMGPITHK